MNCDAVSEREGNATDGRGVDGPLTYPARRFLPCPLQMGRALVVANFVIGVFLTAWGIRGAIDFVSSL